MPNRTTRVSHRVVRRRKAGTRARKTSDPAQTAWDHSLLARVQQVVASYTCREIAEKTGVHPETVRRYVTVGRPSAFFVAALCRAFSVYPSWLLGVAQATPRLVGGAARGRRGVKPSKGRGRRG